MCDHSGHGYVVGVVQRQIHALMEEGRALAFKQSEMEKAVRKARGELKTVEAERTRVGHPAITERWLSLVRLGF
jgi:hypothetical protein